MGFWALPVYEMDRQLVMDPNGGASWMPTTFVVVLMSCATAYYLWWSNHPKYGKNFGSKVYPVVGTYLTLLRNRHHIFDWTTSKLAASQTMTIRNVRPGGLEFWTTANPANVEHILKTKFENYEKGAIYKGIGKDLLGDGIFNADGAGWKVGAIGSATPCKILYLMFYDWNFFMMWIELFFYGTKVLVMSWLFCIQNFPCSVSCWCMLGVTGEVWTKNNLYQFIGGQTHFGMPGGAEIIWPLMNRYKLFFV